ncbi:MAG: hypothetical protein ABFD80_03445, partial [Acidobacteriota bacterium]
DRPLAELSRTGWLEARQFSGGVRRYEETLNRDIFGKRKEVHTQNAISVSSGADENAAAPVFAYVRTPQEAIARNVMPDIILLIAFNFLFFAAGFVAFLRYDVR